MKMIEAEKNRHGVVNKKRRRGKVGRQQARERAEAEAVMKGKQRRKRYGSTAKIQTQASLFGAVFRPLNVTAISETE